MSSRLEKAANVSLIIASAVLVTQAVYRFTASSPKGPSSYRLGDRISDTAQLGFRSAPRTLLLVTASTCHFCRESLPFYAKLAGDAKASGTRVVAVSSESAQQNRKFLEGGGVTTDATVEAAVNHVVIRSTPTLILVANDGRVIRTWVGKLTPDLEGEVYKALGRPGANSTARQPNLAAPLNTAMPRRASQ